MKLMRKPAFLPRPSWYLWLIPALLAFVAQRVLAVYPELVEQYHSRGLFLWLSRPISWVTSLAPFSLTEVCVALGAPALLVLLVLWLIRLIRRPRKLERLGRLLRLLAWTASLAYLMFMLLHGLNYARLPVAESFGLPARERTAGELEEAAAWLAGQTNQLRLLCEENEDGTFKLRKGITATLNSAAAGYTAASVTYPLMAGLPLRPKGVLLSHYWSYTGITGIYMPLLVEANVNIDVPEYQIPDAALHEMAHTRGFAREDEACFIAFLAGLAHPNADFAYSVLVDTTLRCLNALYGADQEAYKRVAALVDEGIWRDLTANNAYWKQFEGPVQEASTQVNNAYLQANLQQDGVRSYGRMVDLVLAWYEKQESQGVLDDSIASRPALN